MSDDYQRIEVITGAARRRLWSTEEKLRIVDETLRSGESISVIARRHGVGGQHEAREDVDVVAYDQFLRETLGDVRCDTAGILADELDLAARDHVAVELHVELDRVVHLSRRVGELAGIRHDQPDLDRLLRGGRGRYQQRAERGHHRGEHRGGSSVESHVRVTSGRGVRTFHRGASVNNQRLCGEGLHGRWP